MSADDAIPARAGAGLPGALPPLRGAPLGVLTLALALATFMQVLDLTIANVAIPTIAGNLGASASQGTWIITSYGVANAVFLPISGRLAGRLGEVRLFVWSTGFFSLTSLFCGLSGSLETLIFFRVLQGAAAGPMVPLSQSLLLNNYPPHKRGMAIALWSMTVAVAPVCGPVLGGWISDNFHWGWIFFINLPVGAAVILLCRRTLRGRETVRDALPVDRMGLLLLILGVGALQVMLDRGKELDWFGSNEIVALAVVSVVCLCLLVVWELGEEYPVVDLRLFASRNFSIGVACISLGMMIYLGTVVLIPLMLQTQLGYTATTAGLAMAPIGLIPLFFSAVVGKNAHKVDTRILATISFLFFALCLWMRTRFSPLMDFAFVVTPQVLQGAALVFFFMPLTSLAFAGLRPEQMASGASLFNFFRTLFGSIGTSALTTLWERREALHHTHLTEHITPYSPTALDALSALERLGLTPEQSAARLAGEISRQGFVLSSTEIFQLCALCFLALIALIWMAKPTAKEGKSP